MSAVSDLNISSLLKTATKLAPAFRDKFDFSPKNHGEPTDFDRLADLAFEAAKAIHAKGKALYDEARAKDAVADGAAARKAFIERPAVVPVEAKEPDSIGVI